jgi:hypothetical protein
MLAAKLCTLVIILPDPTIAGLTVRVGNRQLVPAATIRTVAPPVPVSVVVTAPSAKPFYQVIRGIAGASIPIIVPASGLLGPPPAQAPSSRPAAPLRGSSQNPDRSGSSP